MKGLLALLIIGVMVSGCASSPQKAMNDYNDEARLRASGVSDPGIQEYEQSKFSKTHDMKGFLMSKKAQQAKVSDEKRAKFDQDFPMLFKRTEVCVLRNDFLSEQELPVVTKRCFPANYDYGRTPYTWRDEVINKSISDLSPHFAKVREQMKAEARQRAVEDRQQAAQDKRDREVEAKRAYDNSLRSLVE